MKARAQSDRDRKMPPRATAKTPPRTSRGTGARVEASRPAVSFDVHLLEMKTVDGDVHYTLCDPKGRDAPTLAVHAFPWHTDDPVKRQRYAAVLLLGTLLGEGAPRERFLTDCIDRWLRGWLTSPREVLPALNDWETPRADDTKHGEVDTAIGRGLHAITVLARGRGNPDAIPGFSAAAKKVASSPPKRDAFRLHEERLVRHALNGMGPGRDGRKVNLELWCDAVIQAVTGGYDPARARELAATLLPGLVRDPVSKLPPEQRPILVQTRAAAEALLRRALAHLGVKKGKRVGEPKGGGRKV